MKNGKRPNRRQMKVMVSCGVNPTNWLVTKNTTEKLHLVHRETGKQKVIPNE